LTTMILSIGGVRAEGAKLSEAEIKQLHEAACDEPVHKVKDGWVCGSPRAYGDITSPAFCPVNVLYFESWGIYFGKFTANRSQAIAMYDAACEPHANSFGGMALFNVVDQKFELVRYFPGLRFVDCVVARPGRNGLQIPYCYGSFVAQGTLGEYFGPIQFKPNGTAAFDTWLSAGNDDGHIGPMTDCKTMNKAKPHHISDLRLDEAKSEIVLDVAVLDPRSVASACERFRRGDFNQEERELQKSSPSAKGMAFIRQPDELKFVTMVVRFRPPSSKARLEFTLRPAEP